MGSLNSTGGEGGSSVTVRSVSTSMVGARVRWRSCTTAAGGRGRKEKGRGSQPRRNRGTGSASPRRQIWERREEGERGGASTSLGKGKEPRLEGTRRNTRREKDGRREEPSGRYQD